MDHEIITSDGEIIEGMGQSTSMAVQLQKAEVDQLITTARAYPRSLKRVQSAIMNMATLDEESAEECMYALPRGGKPIKGPSIRFAEILKQSFGNCRAGARVVDVNRIEMFIEAEGVFHDLETNSSTTARVRRRISDKNGRLFKDDMIIVTGNAACSIAMRNAILAGVPKPLWRKAYDSVQATITGDITTLSENRERALKALAAFGVKPEQIYTALGREGLEDITVDDIATLRGMYSALKNGEATVEEMFFGTVKAASPHEKLADPLSDEPIKPQKATSGKADAAAVSSASQPDTAPTGEILTTDNTNSGSPLSGPEEAGSQRLAKSVEAGGVATASPAVAIPADQRHNFLSFATVLTKTLRNDDLDKDAKERVIEDADLNWKDVIPQPLWKKMASLKISAIVSAKEAKAGRYIAFAADMLEVSPEEIGG